MTRVTVDIKVPDDWDDEDINDMLDDIAGTVGAMETNKEQHPRAEKARWVRHRWVKEWQPEK